MTRTSSWKHPVNSYSEVYATKLRETDKAYHLTITIVSGSVIQPKTVWIPISQTQKSRYDPATKSWVGLIADWILEKNNLVVDSDPNDPEEAPGDNTPEAYDPDDIPF